MRYLSRLSNSQYVWLIGVSILSTAIVALGWFFQPNRAKNPVVSLTTEMTIRELAPKLGVTGKALAREFDLPLNDQVDHIAGGTS